MSFVKPRNILSSIGYFNVYLCMSNPYIYINNNNGRDYMSEIQYKIIENIISQIFKRNIIE